VDDWLSSAAASIGADGLSDDETRAILELARLAAHDSGDRTNAPLLCYLVGRTQGDRPLDELAEAIVRSTS
jgi:Domain of unknown function (DUF6457)